jgi:hypothetical protein
MSKLVDRIGQFTTIPNSVIQLWPKIGVDAMCIFLYLRYRTNSQSEMAFPSYTTITSDTGMRRERIAKAMRSLESYGLVERKRRFSASTLYTLKLPDVISPPVEPMEAPISPPVELPLVRLSNTNQIDLNKIESDKTQFKTADIKAAFSSCIDYPINWAAGSGSSAKWLAENGYTPDDVIGCYKVMSADPWWSDKQITLRNICGKIGDWKSHKQSKQTIKLTGVVHA